MLIMILALAAEPEFKKIYDQRLFDRQLKETSQQLPESFFQRYRYYKTEQEIVFKTYQSSFMAFPKFESNI